MKVYPKYATPPTIPFQGKGLLKSANIEKSKQFLEATGVVVMTSIPMFMFVYLQNVFQKIFGADSGKKLKNP